MEKYDIGTYKRHILPWSRHISRRKLMCGDVQFTHGCLDVYYRSWDKRKNPCLCRNLHFPTQWTIRTWKALGLWPHAFYALMMHLISICVISAWAWLLLYLQLFSLHTQRTHCSKVIASPEKWHVVLIIVDTISLVDYEFGGAGLPAAFDFCTIFNFHLWSAVARK